MSTLGYRLARLSLLALATTWILTCPVLADTGDKPVKLVVIVPEGAIVTIDGTKTTSTGTRRTFESPPVAVGKKYSYMIKAVWTGADGKEVVHEKKFPVKPGETNEIDLTKGETTKVAPPVPKAKLTVEGPGPVEIVAGARKAITIKIKREYFKEPVKVTFSGAPKGIKIPDLTIAEDKTEGSVEVAVPIEAKAGTSTIAVSARSDRAKANAEFKLTVKPLATFLALAVPATVDVEAGGKKTFEVEIRRQDVEGPAKVRFEGLPAGVKIADATIAADAKKAMVEVSAAKDAKVGMADVSVKAEVGSAKVESSFKLNVKAGPKNDKDKDTKDKEKGK